VAEIRIATERFLLRPLVPDDATPRYSAWFDEPQSSRYIVSAGSTHDVPALRAYIEDRAGRRDVLFLGIFVRDTNEHIGNIKFEPINEHEHYAIMGMMVGEPAWRGRGVAREVLDAAADWLGRERSVREIVLGVAPTHAAAIEAYEKSGFSVAATERIRADPVETVTMVRRIP
jgi:RimJ/RimL family protein N-acetyltransferase